MIDDNQIYGPFVPTAKMARELGLRRYFTGTPCKRNHLSPRATISHICRDCHTQWKRERMAIDSEFASRERDYANTYRKERRLIDEEFAERNRAADRRSWATNKTRREQSYASKAKRMECPVYRKNINIKLGPSRAKWKQNNPERVAIDNRLRRSRERNAEGTHTVSDIERIIKSQRYRCAYCRSSVRLRKNRHVDHIKALSVGGTNWPNNLQILCPPCNESKSNIDPLIFARRKGLLL